MQSRDRKRDRRREVTLLWALLPFPCLSFSLSLSHTHAHIHYRHFLCSSVDEQLKRLHLLHRLKSLCLAVCETAGFSLHIWELIIPGLPSFSAISRCEKTQQRPKTSPARDKIGQWNGVWWRGGVGGVGWVMKFVGVMHFWHYPLCNQTKSS